MVFTRDEWPLVDQQKIGVSAAPISPSKLGENAKFVFALPPRWIGFVGTLGQDEAGKMPETFSAFSVCWRSRDDLVRAHMKVG
jgi:hypothetical protein